MKLSKRASSAIYLAVVMLALPIAIFASQNTVNLAPKASSGDITQEISSSDSSSKKSHLKFNLAAFPQTIKCRVGETCTGSFEGQGNNLSGNLFMDIDLLPEGLSQNTCQPKGVLDSSTLVCGFSGTPTKAGEYRVMVTLRSETDTSIQKTVSLNIQSD